MAGNVVPGAAKPLIPYLRQSRAKERTISISEQRRSIEQWAEREGVVLAEAVVEQGVSGSKPWRQRELGKVVEACERGEAAGVVVAFQDRLSRENGLGTAEVWEALQAADARLVAAAEGLDTAAGDQEMLFTIKAAIAREQWKRFKRNWDDAKRNAVERGDHFAARVPIGYKRADREDGSKGLVPDPETSDAIRDLFRMRAAGMSWNELCKHLEAKGVTPTRANHWSINGIRRVVMNPVYSGEARNGEWTNPNAHEPLVTRAEWNAAQVKHEGRVTRGTEGARLSGLPRCASCGGRLTAEMPAVDTHPRTAKHLADLARLAKEMPKLPGRYRCRPRMNPANEICSAPAAANMRDLDAFVVREFLQHYGEWFGQRDINIDQPDTSHLRRAVDHTKDNLEVLISDPASLAALSPENRAQLLARAQASVDAAQSALDAVEVKALGGLAGFYGLADYFEPDSFHEARVPEQRLLLTAGIERIVIRRGREPIEQRTTIEWAE